MSRIWMNLTSETQNCATRPAYCFISTYSDDWQSKYFNYLLMQTCSWKTFRAPVGFTVTNTAGKWHQPQNDYYRHWPCPGNKKYTRGREAKYWALHSSTNLKRFWFFVHLMLHFSFTIALFLWQSQWFSCSSAPLFQSLIANTCVCACEDSSLKYSEWLPCIDQAVGLLMSRHRCCSEFTLFNNDL